MTTTSSPKAAAMRSVERIKACLNGGRRPDEHPAVPVTPAELASAASGAVQAGAEAVHLHARGRDGAESLQAADLAAAVGAVRRACPGIPIGVSTGLWMVDGDVRARRELVRSWGSLPAVQRPDFASVNVSEPGFAELAALVVDLGIGLEVGVWSPDDVVPVSRVGDIGRILVEVIDVPAQSAVEAADEILRRLDAAGLTAPRLLHGEHTACWPLVAQAGRLGLPTRIGLEDTTVGPSGEPVQDNAELVCLALAVWRAPHSSDA
jgi:uncharacterized protein (DUF849 family)